MDELRQEYQLIIDYCKSNGFSLFFGTFSTKNLTTVTWTESNQRGWKEFLNGLGIKESHEILIVETTEFNIEDYVDSEELESQTDEELKKKVHSQMKSLIEHEGQLANISISFIKASVCYQFSKYSNWLDKIDELVKLCNEFEKLNADIYQNEEGEPKYKKLTKEEIEKYVSKIIQQEDFLRTAQAYQRKEIIYDLFETELHKLSIYQLINPAELALDKYLRAKVQELKSAGKTKKEICAELNISKDRIVKYH